MKSKASPAVEGTVNTLRLVTRRRKDAHTVAGTANVSPAVSAESNHELTSG